MRYVYLWCWLVGGYIVLALLPMVIAVVCDKVIIPFILWLHRVGVLKAHR